MAANSNIEWTDRTWNPVSGCNFASEGCRNCYAVGMSHRLEAMGQEKYSGLTVLNARNERHFNGTVKTHEAALTDPLGWKKPQKVFVNSMSDLFHKDVPFEFIDKVFAVMALCPQHTFQVLTKRPERMAAYFNAKPHGEDGWNIGRGEHGVRTVLFDWQRGECGWLNDLPVWDKARGLIPLADQGGEVPFPLPNVWLGTSVENQEAADKRIPHLLECPAAVRFLSCEPLLGAVDLTFITSGPDSGLGWTYRHWDALGGHNWCDAGDSIQRVGTGPVHWVIAGGESGHKARPMHPDWVRSIRDQCAAAGVPFHFKQWGGWVPENVVDPHGVRDPLYFHEGPRAGESRYESICLGVNGETSKDTDKIKDHTPVVMYRVGKKSAGRTLDGVTHDAFPEVAHA